MKCLTTTMLCALMLIAATSTDAQDDPAAQSPGTDPTPKTGRYTTTFNERSPLSTITAVTSRFRTEPRQPPADYTLADESFEVYAPADYDGTERYGLIIWVSPGPNGAPPAGYLPVLDQHKLIWIGANNSGNPRSFWHRTGLSLDALHNITKQYDIDPMRTYVSGVSGGGRCSSRIGLTYADLFAGAFPIIGVDFFTRLPHPDSTTVRLLFWAPAFKPPSPQVLRKAKRDNRYVLLTGESDGNRAQTLVTYQYGLKRARFAYATYLEVPGMGHTRPPADWFDKGIVALDAPLDEVRERRESKAKRAMDRAMDRLSRSPLHGIQALRQLLKDFPDTTYAPRAAEELQRAADGQPPTQHDSTEPDETKRNPRPPPPDEAREDLTLARNYLQAGRTDLAYDLLTGLIRNHPDTEEAEQARALLEGMTAQ